MLLGFDLKHLCIPKIFYNKNYLVIKLLIDFKRRKKRFRRSGKNMYLVIAVVVM